MAAWQAFQGHTTPAPPLSVMPTPPPTQAPSTETTAVGSITNGLGSISITSGAQEHAGPSTSHKGPTNAASQETKVLLEEDPRIYLVLRGSHPGVYQGR